VSQSFNLSRWLVRLGYKRQDEPPGLYSVQPTQIVSDVRYLTPDVTPPSMIVGGSEIQHVGEWGAFQLTSNSPGGILILGGQINAATTVHILIGNAPFAWVTGPAALIPSIIQGPTTTIGEVGTAPPIAIDTLPRFTPNDFWPMDSRGIYVPNGSFFQILCVNNNLRLTGIFHVVELPEMRGT
jgi:hypothetical protein